MNYYDEELRRLQQQLSVKKQLEAELDDLFEQQDELKAKVREFEKTKWSEDADVERLEGGSLYAFFYRVIGKMDEMLDKEREEAYAAAVKYDAAAAELAAVESAIEKCNSKLREVRNSEEQYMDLLKQKQEAIKNSGSKEAAEIFQLEARIADLENQKREIGEAVSAGYSALDISKQILESLSSADGWATWDLLGGGLIADALKYSHVDEAQKQIEELQVALRRFKTELADVTIYADLKVSVDGILRFADYFLDGLFVDWAVRDEIKKSRTQVQDTQDQIQSVLDTLEGMKHAFECEAAEVKRQIEELVREAKAW